MVGSVSRGGRAAALPGVLLIMGARRMEVINSTASATCRRSGPGMFSAEWPVGQGPAPAAPTPCGQLPLRKLLGSASFSVGTWCGPLPPVCPSHPPCPRQQALAGAPGFSAHHTGHAPALGCGVRSYLSPPMSLAQCRRFSARTPRHLYGSPPWLPAPQALSNRPFVSARLSCWARSCGCSQSWTLKR